MKWPWNREKKKAISRAPIDVVALQSSVRARHVWRRRMIIMCFGATCIATVLWLIFSSSFARVRDIQIIGNKETSREDIVHFLEDTIRAKSWVHTLLGQSYIFLWRNGDISVNPQLLPYVRTMTVDVSYPARVVRVSVIEREPFGIWCRMNTPVAPVAELSSSTEPVVQSTHECLWFDKDGFALGEAPFAEGNLIYLVRDYSKAMNLRPASRVLTEFEIAPFFSIVNVLHIAGVSVSEIRRDDQSLKELIVQTTNGPKLYFSLRFPADPALAVLASLWPDPSKTLNLQYVDFRAENRAFYK